MGITEQGLEFLVSAQRSGVRYDRTLTIGRQSLLVAGDRLAEVMGPVPVRSQREPGAGQGSFAEPVLAHLGADSVESIDVSTFEGATIIHDLNTPVPESLHGRFSTVIDGGALEHVFDVPTALRSCMAMVETGGHLLLMSPVNGAAGHGFYQFSPELFFRALAPEHGYTVERVLLAEVRPRARWYRVTDPADVGRRLEFTTRHQAYLYVQARRTGSGPVLDTPPAQSDYASAWARSGRSDAGAPASEAADAVATPRIKAALKRVPMAIPTIRAGRGVVQAARRRRHRFRLEASGFVPLGRRLT